MNQIAPPPKIEIIPPTAPFSEAQRSWLNGFFAGLLSNDPAVPLSAEQGAALLPGAAAEDNDDDAPWHDQTLPIAERMKLADGRPLKRRMMAAMAQQDCGQCGYNCRDYSSAIADKSEARLNLCVPGGKETARMLKSLYEEIDKAPAASKPTAGAGTDAPVVTVTVAEPGRSRDNPADAIFLGRRLLNKKGSEKETYHIDFDLSESRLDYVVGDSFGVFANNDIGLVDQVLPHTVPNQILRFVDAKRRILAEMAPPDARFGWPKRNGFVQPLVDRVLCDGLERFEHVEVRFATEVVDATQDADGVCVTVRTGGGDETQVLTAAYLVGADGGSSSTRVPDITKRSGSGGTAIPRC